MTIVAGAFAPVHRASSRTPLRSTRIEPIAVELLRGPTTSTSQPSSDARREPSSLSRTWSTCRVRLRLCPPPSRSAVSATCGRRRRKVVQAATETRSTRSRPREEAQASSAYGSMFPQRIVGPPDRSGRPRPGRKRSRRRRTAIRPPRDHGTSSVHDDAVPGCEAISDGPVVWFDRPVRTFQPNVEFRSRSSR